MFKESLKLIEVGYAEIKPGSQPLHQPVFTPVTLDVPEATQYVHIAITAVDVSFGTTENRKASELVGLWFEVANRDTSQLKTGKFKFDFKAVLQNKPDMNNTGDWTGVFYVEFMCFG